ncbi:MAG: hypothetical protein IKZ87_01485 [Actinomycetaceae bacterium]|nr:hypothetical protein [Actinomycetaceae bacterium]
MATKAAKTTKRTAKPKRIAKTTVLSLGFTAKQIEEWLPEPMEVPNPHYKSGPPMLLWYEKDVKRAMRTKRFQRHLEERASRKAAAAKAVETKKRKTAAYVDEMIGKIEVRAVDVAKSNFEHAVLSGHEDDWGCGPRNKDDVPKHIWQRWAVNYIRHQLTRYDEELYNTKGMVGFSDQYSRYKAAVLDAIAQMYPQFAKECERQKTPRH